MLEWVKDQDDYKMYVAGGAVYLKVAFTFGKGVKGFKVQVNNRSIKPLFSDVEQAKRAALLFAKKVLKEAMTEINDICPD